MRDSHKDFFDRLAEEWDLNFTAEDLERLSHLVDSLGVSEGMDIIDLGCGTGVLFDLLRRRVGPDGSVTGVDYSIEMVRVAHRNFPFDNVNVVDMAVSFSAFPHFSDKQRVLKEVNRVLKSGAMFYIIHLQSSKDLASMHKRIGGPVEHDHLPTPEELRQMFSASSFTDVNIEDHPGLFLASAVNTK
jgi:ubiquinone/menaquinone biosynthesis C-methylase UbiE